MLSLLQGWGVVCLLFRYNLVLCDLISCVSLGRVLKFVYVGRIGKNGLAIFRYL